MIRQETAAALPRPLLLFVPRPMRLQFAPMLPGLPVSFRFLRPVVFDDSRHLAWNPESCPCVLPSAANAVGELVKLRFRRVGRIEPAAKFAAAVERRPRFARGCPELLGVLDGRLDVPIPRLAIRQPQTVIAGESELLALEVAEESVESFGASVSADPFFAFGSAFSQIIAIAKLRSLDSSAFFS